LNELIKRAGGEEFINSEEVKMTQKKMLKEL